MSAYVIAVSGVRRVPDGAAVTLNDLWHLGSNFKAFTAMLAATAVDRGEIEWTTTLAEAFPELEPTMLEAYRGVTLRDLLAHRAGVPANPDRQFVSGQTRAGGTHVPVVTRACAMRASNASGSFESWAQVTRTTRKPEAASAESRRRSASNAAREEWNA